MNIVLSIQIFLIYCEFKAGLLYSGIISRLIRLYFCPLAVFVLTLVNCCLVPCKFKLMSFITIFIYGHFARTRQIKRIKAVECQFYTIITGRSRSRNCAICSRVKFLIAIQYGIAARNLIFMLSLENQLNLNITKLLLIISGNPFLCNGKSRILLHSVGYGSAIINGVIAVFPFSHSLRKNICSIKISFVVKAAEILLIIRTGLGFSCKIDIRIAVRIIRCEVFYRELL